MTELPSAPLGHRTNYRVHLPVFEGPLDLLLHLIEREELDITRVSLALVTDQYLAYLAALEEMQVEDLTGFVVVAARLLLIKSQALLPRPPSPAPQAQEDAGDELLRQLLAYKRYKQAAEELWGRHFQGMRSYVRVAPRPTLEPGIEHLEAVPLEALLAVARKVLRSRAPASPVNHVVPEISVTIDAQISQITQRLAQQAKVTFSALLSMAYSRQEVIITLMAVLELIKRQQIQVQQEHMFGEITIAAKTSDADHSSDESLS